jgi:hypothetical protein
MASLPAAYPTPTAFTSVLQMKFPDDAYEPSTVQAAESDYLSLRLAQVCMKNLGFDFLPTLTTAVIAQSNKTEQEFKTRLYGISDPTAATTYGYHLPTWTNGHMDGQTLSQLPSDEQAALEGRGSKTYDGKAVPAGGCLGQSADLLRQAGVGTDGPAGGSQTPAVTPRTIEVDAFQDAQADPRVLAVNAKWSSCMASFGYHFNSPLSALGQSRWASAATAGRAEIQTAERDVTCKLRVNLLGVEYSVQSGYEQAAIAENSQAMAIAKAQLDTEAAGLNQLMKQYAQ